MQAKAVLGLVSPRKAPMTALAREPDWVQFEPKTLHERMMIEAETQIQQNWTDVAIHDKRKLRTIPSHHACVWVVRAEGSNLLPTYCKLSEASKWKKDSAARRIHPLLAFLCLCQDYRAKFRANFKPESSSYYVIIKGKNEKEGQIIPVSFKEIADFAMAGQFVWTEDGYRTPAEAC